MYEALLKYLGTVPALYAPCTSPFWDDTHISKYMLEAHLNPDWEAASRKHEFMKRSAQWIANEVGGAGKALLDLGCGPGLYAELFCEHGFEVTGVDMSRRSIEYARTGAHADKITYINQNYLTLDYEAKFDVVTLIYCDFGVLSPADRHTLLNIIRKALKPGGAFIVDGWTFAELANINMTSRFSSCPNGGFWSAEPYLCLERGFSFPETANYLEQDVIVTKDKCECYNLWNQLYSADSLANEMRCAGFNSFRFYGDVAGAPMSDESHTLCAIATV